MSIDKFYEQLKGEGIKLKQGFLNFWIPIILIIKKEDYSLYHENGEYIPHLSHDVLDLIYKSPKKFKIKGLSDNGVNSNYLNFYKELTGFNDSNVKGLESSYITIYSNFLKFYRGLPDFSKKTNQLSKEVIEVRNAISTAKDPESALFDKIPAALGYHNIKENSQLDNFVSDLKNAIRSLRTVYEELVNNIYCQITSYFDKDFKSFSDYKEFILNQFESIKPDSIVDSKLKLFHSRLISKMDMKTPYIEGLIDVILGKRLDKVQDQDLTIINQRLIGNFETLISLIDIHKLKVESSEQVYNLKIITKDADINLNSNLIIPKNKNQEIEKLQNEISAILGVDSNVNRVALLKLLEKEYSISGWNMFHCNTTIKHINDYILHKFEKYNLNIVNCIEHSYFLGGCDKAISQIKLIYKYTFHDGKNTIKYIKESLDMIEKNILAGSYNKALALSCLNRNLEKYVKKNF